VPEVWEAAEVISADRQAFGVDQAGVDEDEQIGFDALFALAGEEAAE